MFEIEKNVPAPSGDRVSWPWKDMAVGDSVLFDDPDISLKAQVRCHAYGSVFGAKFKTRKEGDGIRVWRIA